MTSPTPPPDLEEVRSHANRMGLSCACENPHCTEERAWAERTLIRLAEEVESHREAHIDKLRLTRLLDVALHGEDGAAKQASLCDLIVPAKRLAEEVERMRKVLGGYRVWENQELKEEISRLTRELETEREKSREEK